jgi:hypothetical protein
MWQPYWIRVPSSVRRSAPPQSGQAIVTGWSSVYSAVISFLWGLADKGS